MTHDFYPDWNGASIHLKHTWAGIGNIDQFRWLSRADVQRQLVMARDEIGLRHVRAVAMYSPELAVWDYDLADWRCEEKARRPNWQLIDLSIEALLDIGLKPIYTTCFTPVGMTDDPSGCFPDQNRIGIPKDLTIWQKFVSEGIRHHIKRYGIEEVSSWFFECWNEPNLRGGFFGGSQQDFFDLWSATWRAVKSVDERLRIGGPSTARAEWITEFLDYAANHGTSPDYLITHVYNNDSETNPLSPFDGPASFRVKDSPHFASGVVRGLKKELEQRGWQGEVHWNEWGRSWFLFDPLKETALEAAFIVKTMIETSQDSDAFAFWCLSDIYNQGGFQSSEFQGNYGLLSLHGLRKPGWFAHVMLEKLGNLKVEVLGGDDLTGALATVSEGEFKLLIFAYPNLAEDESKTLRIRVAIPAEKKSITLTRLGAEENNIIAHWRAAGAKPYPSPLEIQKLRDINVLQAAESNEVTVTNETAEFTMERPGVALIQFKQL